MMSHQEVMSSLLGSFNSTDYQQYVDRQKTNSISHLTNDNLISRGLNITFHLF